MKARKQKGNVQGTNEDSQKGLAGNSQARLNLPKHSFPFLSIQIARRLLEVTKLPFSLSDYFLSINEQFKVNLI
jgi:hypothetical protein